MKELSRNELKVALDRCAELTGDREFIVVGSMSILGHDDVQSKDLKTSEDIDLFPREGETGEKNEHIQMEVGSGSIFERENNFYIEGVGRWTMMTAAKGWEDRMVAIQTDNGVTGWCISPLDLAYNKLEAGRDKDLKYVQELVRSEVTPLPQLEEFISQHADAAWRLERLQTNLKRAQEFTESPDGDLTEITIEDMLKSFGVQTDSPEQRPSNPDLETRLVELQSTEDIAETFSQGLAGGDEDGHPPEHRSRGDHHER